MAVFAVAAAIVAPPSKNNPVANGNANADRQNVNASFILVADEPLHSNDKPVVIFLETLHWFL